MFSMILKDNWELVSHIQAELGEGPTWDYRLNKLYWIDIFGQKIFCHDPLTGQTESISIAQKIGCLALTDNPTVLLTAQKHGIYFTNIISGESKLITSPESNLPNNRFNDGKIDPLGNFWAGTMDEVYNTKEVANLYKIKSNQDTELMIPKLSCSNGLAWDLAKNKFYLIDTGVRKLFSFDYNKGEINNQQEVFKFDDTQGIPDGMTIDSEGKLWIGFWNGNKVIRFDPDTKETLTEIHLPVSKVTSCTFGGKKLNDLYITTAKIGLSEEDLKDQPLAGSTFVIKNLPYKGINTNLFKLT